MNPDYILITGIKSPLRLQALFDSSFVDVAYVELLDDDKVKILVESDTDLRNEKDLKWISDLITTALQELGEEGTIADIVFEAP